MGLEAELGEVLTAFCRVPRSCTVVPLGKGNINDTWLVEEEGRPFVLQRINSNVFPYPERIIINFGVITAHLAGGGGHGLRASGPRHTLSGAPYYESRGGRLWRGQTYLEHVSYGQLQSARQARDLGRVLALFHRLLLDLDPQKLAEPLPGFHDLRSYLKDYSSLSAPARAENADGRVRYCCEIIKKYSSDAVALHDAADSGSVRRQLVHGDPKLDNFMFDRRGGCRGLLDLDTVGPGLVYLDIGDCLRSCCNGPGEKGSELLTFDLELFVQFLKGYLGAGQDHADPPVGLFIYHGIVHICFELGLRFFTDYLRGNVYFKVTGPEDNLEKSVQQFQLLEDVIEKKTDILIKTRSVAAELTGLD